MTVRPGTYILVLTLAQGREETVGALGRLYFPAGCYCYVGSARAGLDQRIGRHLRRTKTCKWHIDYLTTVADRVEAYESYPEAIPECELGHLCCECGGVPAAAHFGCSDCHCATHLFRVTSATVTALVARAGLVPFRGRHYYKRRKATRGHKVTLHQKQWGTIDMDSEKLSREVTPEIISKLVAIVGQDNVNTSDMDRMLYSHDLAPLPKEAGMAFKNVPDVVVRPTKIEDVAAIMRLAYQCGIAVTPRGNSTWGLGGSMPIAAGILLDMSSKMNQIISVDVENQAVKVMAGATWKATLDACMAKGFIIGSYPSSFPAATVGAWLNTNGMGVGSFKYGSAKDNVLNMQVVLPDGTLVETGYDNIGAYMSGYNLNQFFAGAEGTLGVVCTVTFKMYPMGVIKPLAYEFTEKLSDADPAIQAIIRHASIKPLHISWSDFNHFANQRKAGCEAPDVNNVVLITLQEDQKVLDCEIPMVDEIMAAAGGKRLSDEIGEHEWSERCYEFRARKAGVGEIPAEVITPANCWGKFIDVCYESFPVMKMEVGGVIGQIVDRQTALYMPYYFKDDESLIGMTAFAFNFYLGDRAAEFGGRSTGLGVFFAWNLDNMHDAATVGFMRDLKTFVDPHDVMNPGHVVCGMTRFGINMSYGLMTFGSNLMQMMKKILPENTTFADNIERFRYNQLEEEKEADRKHVLGYGAL